MCKISEIVKITKSSYPLGNLPERWNEAMLEQTELTMKE